MSPFNYEFAWSTAGGYEALQNALFAMVSDSLNAEALLRGTLRIASPSMKSGSDCRTWAADAGRRGRSGGHMPCSCRRLTMLLSSLPQPQKECCAPHGAAAQLACARMEAVQPDYADPSRVEESQCSDSISIDQGHKQESLQTSTIYLRETP